MKLLVLSALLFPEAATAFTSPRPVVISSRMSTVRKMVDTEEKQSGVFSEEVQQEAKEVLQKVGWARPVDDGEMTSIDPFVQQINEGIQKDYGVGLDDLLNPAKVGEGISRPWQGWNYLVAILRSL